MIKFLWGTRMPIWVGDLPGDSLRLTRSFGYPQFNGAAVPLYNKGTRMVCVSEATARGDFPRHDDIMMRFGGNASMEKLSKPVDTQQVAAVDGVDFVKKHGRGYYACLPDGWEKVIFIPHEWCAFRRICMPDVIKHTANIYDNYILGVNSPVFELTDIRYAVDQFGNSIVHADSGFVPAVGTTVAVVQTKADAVEIDEGVEHVNLLFVGKQPDSVYLPDSCVSCWIPHESKFKLSIGEKLASVWDYWSSVWGKPCGALKSGETSADGLVAVRKNC